MTSGRTDASTSTEDAKGRPLCLFYFTHPFGVLSPEPPTVLAAGAFLGMQPVACFRAPPSPSDEYATTSSSHPARPTRPVRLVRHFAPPAAGSSGSSSLFSGEAWLGGGGGGRLVPYGRTLPPLRLPTPRDLMWDSSEEAWPVPCSTRERFSLPPIELPRSPPPQPCRRALPARRRRTRLSGVQRMVTCLMRRTVKDARPAMGYILDNCPVVQACCCCVPLREGTGGVAAAGLVWGVLCLLLFSGEGARAAERAGLPAELGAGLRYAHGALGVLLLAVHALLVAAVLHESDSLCEVYLWFMVLLGAALLVATVAVGVAAALGGHTAFAGCYAAIMLGALLFTAYCSVVVGNYRMTLP